MTIRTTRRFCRRPMFEHVIIDFENTMLPWYEVYEFERVLYVQQ